MKAPESGAFVVVALEQVWSNFAELFAGSQSTAETTDETEAARCRPRTRITAKLRDEVTRRYRAGQASRTIASELHVGKATVLKILREGGEPIKNQGVRYESSASLSSKRAGDELVEFARTHQPRQR